MRTFYSIMPDLISDEAAGLKTEHNYLIKKETFQSNPIFSMMEGALSIGQAFAVLSAGRNPHYKSDPVELFRKLIETNTFNQLAGLLPLARIAPMVHEGMYFNDPIDPKTFKLTSALQKNLAAERNAVYEKNHENSSGVTFNGCPVARKNTPVQHEDGSPGKIEESGINLMAKVFADYLEHYYSQTQAA